MQAPVAISPANFKSPEVRLSTPADTLKKRKESSKPGHVGLSNATKAVPVRKVLRGRVASREEASKGRATVQQRARIAEKTVWIMGGVVSGRVDDPAS